MRAAETAILTGSYADAAVVGGELFDRLRDQASRRWVADALEIGALVMASRDDDIAASQLLGTADALRSASGEEDAAGRSLAGLVRRLRDRLALEIIGSGTALPVDDAVARARAALDARS